MSRIGPVRYDANHMKLVVGMLRRARRARIEEEQDKLYAQGKAFGIHCRTHGEPCKEDGCEWEGD
jgi:hypothetical protein